MHLFDVAARHRSWLAQSQSVVAENISNVNTPEYKARRVQDFSEVMRNVTPVRLAATQRGHIATSAGSASAAEELTVSDVSTHSGNTVDLDAELMRAGEVRGGYALNASVVKTFNRMLMASVRS